MNLISRFTECKRAYAEGIRDESDKSLSEAVWTAEADLNFLRGDANLVSDSTTRDSLLAVLPIGLDADGQPKVSMQDLITMQQELMTGIVQVNERGRVYVVDLSLKELTADEARVRVVVIRRYIPPGGPDPPPTGCYVLHDLNGGVDAVSVMNQYLTYMENEAWITDWHPSFFVSVSSMMLYWDNTPYGSVGGYLTYIGTSEQLGGLEWLAGGPAGELVCFPGYYTKYEALRSWIMSQWEDIPGRVLVDQHYDWYYAYLGNNPMAYGSPYYPMGPYSHGYRCRRGMRIRI